MKMMKKTLAILLALIMISSSFVCFAAELNQDAVAAHKGQYKNYVLLGDSVASGYRDQMNEYDELYNELYMDSTYCRYEGSYGDVLADAIIDPDGGTMTALAGPGFRTVEMRYMLEDDFAATCTDEYLFHPSHLYIYEDQYCEECGEFLLPGSEHYRKEFKKAIAEADLITLGLGGNDWGAYLGWVISDVMKKEHVPAEYMEMANKVIEEGTMDIATVEKLVEIANMAGLVNELLQTVPAALEYGLAGFFSNWDIVIQDIYALNPDVTLMVVGMSDNGLKGKYYDYPEYGIVGEPVNPEDTDAGTATTDIMSLVVEFIMTVGNKPLIDGAEKFGYTYVDTDGTTYVDSHPDAAGHINIANKIIEALPDSVVSKRFDDVTPGHKNYKAIEYVVLNGIMDGTSENKFSPDEAITKGQLEAAKNAICGTNYATDNTAKANLLDFIFALIKCGLKSGLTGFIKSFSIMYNLIYDNNLNLGASITRADAAVYFYTICK